MADLEDVLALQTTNRALFTSLEWEALAGRITIHLAPCVLTAAEFDSVLESIQSLPRSFRRRPLEVLLSRIVFCLHHSEWPARFDRVLDALKPLPEDDRLEILGELALTIRQLPDIDRSSRFDDVLNETGRLPAEKRHRVLNRLVDVFSNWMPGPVPTARFDRLLSAAESFSVADRMALTYLADRIGDLPVDQRAIRIERVLGITNRLPAEQRGLPLSALVNRFRGLAEVHQETTMGWFLGAVSRLPEIDRRAILDALCWRKQWGWLSPAAGAAVDAAIAAEPARRS